MHPLEAPGAHSQALDRFLEHFDLRRGSCSREFLSAVATAFSTLPYENLSKILRWSESGGSEGARRGPDEVISEHIRLGTGGTCFSLTATLLHILRGLGWRAEPILADRHYGADTHCALVVWIDGAPHLIDPGYLIVKPIPLDPDLLKSGAAEDGAGVRVRTSFNDVVLVPTGDGERIELHTEHRGQRSHRLTLKTGPVDAGTFLRAWDASFKWDMMRYPVLTRVSGDLHVYLQGQRLQRRGRTELRREELRAEEVASRIRSEFGLDATLVERAINVLKRQGEFGGKSL